MVQQLRATFSEIRNSLNNGFIAGAAIVFLILIGLPAGLSGREALASLALPIFVLTAIAFGVITVRQHEKSIAWGKLARNGVALGVGIALVFLLFMSLINRWQSRGFPVTSYFAEVTLGTTERLSGVPQAELFANPKIDPVTQKLPPDAKLRTNPMQLAINNDEISVFNLGVIQFGGLYGTALVLALAAFASALVYKGLQLIDWVKFREQFNARFSPTTSQNRLIKNLPLIWHWIQLLLPTLLFIMFWATVPISYNTSFWRSILGDERVDSMGIRHILFDLGKNLGLGTSGRQTTQLLLCFGVIVTLLIAWRSVKPRRSSLSYGLRVGINIAFIIGAFLLAVWRIQADKVAVITPTLEILGLNHQSPIDASRGAAFLLAIILSGVAIFGNRDTSRFDSIFVGISGASLLLTMPLFMDQYQTAVLNLVAIYIMLGLGLNIVVGYAGLLDLGYVAFFAVGAYMYAFIESKSQYATTQHITVSHANNISFAIITSVVVVPLVIFGLSWLWKSRQEKRSIAPDGSAHLQKMAPLWKDQPPLLISLGLVVFAVAVALISTELFKEIGVFSGIERVSPFLLGLILAFFAAAFAGTILGFPVLRLRSDYLAIVTLGFGEIISIALENLVDVTGGPFGAQGVPKPLPAGASIAQSNLVLLYIGLVGATIVGIISLRLRSSRLGRSWTALRSDEDIAQAMGINLVNSKLLAFAIGAAFAGVGGLMLAARQSNLFPSDFSLTVSINVLALVIIGGMGSVPGVVIGAIVLVGLPETLRAVEDYRIMMFGALLVVTMLIRPKGLLPAPLTSLEEQAKQLRREQAENGDKDE